MKTKAKMKEKKHSNIKKPKIKKEKVLIVAQEIKFARLLSGNEKKTRDRVLKTFKKWLLNCFDKGYVFKEDDFTRVWKGLFYAVWMSDKPLVQEELCETISGILDLFPTKQIKYALMMTKAGFKVLATEWYGIDQHRMDKFLMLVRRYLRGSLRCLQRCEWSLKSCQMYSEMLSGSDGLLFVKTPLYARNAGSMLLHFVDCFLEELSKISSGEIPAASLVSLLRPFCQYMCKGESIPLCVSTRRVLTALLRQSEHGLAYQEKTKAWERMGCPRGGPDALELESDDESENEQPDDDDDNEDYENKDKVVALDPRAGRVDVLLAPLPVPAAEIAQMLRELLATATSKAHKRTKICLQRFEQLARDEYPLPVTDVFNDEDDISKPNTRNSAAELHVLDKALVQSADELALRGLSRKHRKRLLAKSRAGLSIVEDVETIRETSDASTNGNWEVEPTVPNNAKKTNSSNKENVNKGKQSKKRKHPDAKTDASNKKHKPAQRECKQKNEEVAKEDNTKKCYQKKTKAQKNKNKNQTLLNGAQDVNIIPKLNVTKENIKTKHDNRQSKHKQLKADTPVKQIDKRWEKNHASQSSQTITDKVLVKSNQMKSGVAEKQNQTEQKSIETPKQEKKAPSLLVNKVKNYQKRTNDKVNQQKKFETPKKVKFVLKNNCMQGPIDYYKSVRQSPNIPFDSSKQPTKTNLKVSTPSPINPFFKKKLRIK